MILTSRTISLILQAFIFIFPFMIYFRQSSGEIHHTLQKFVLLSLISLLLWLLFLSRWIIHKRTIEEKMNSVGNALLLLVFLILFSTFLSVDQYTSIYGTKYRYEGAIALLSYLSLFIFSDHFLPEKRHGRIFIILGIGAFFSAIYGIIQHFSLSLFKVGSYYRAESFFDNPNFFSTYLVIMILLVSTLYLYGQKLRYLLVWYFIHLTLFLALIYTMTRSGWLGIIVGFSFMTIFIVTKRKYLWKRWGLLLLSLVAIFIVVNLNNENSYFNRVNTIVKEAMVMINIEESETRDSVGSGRWYIWRNALPLLDDHILLGSGPDTFGLVFPQTDGTQMFDKAHNEYLQMAITLGIPALLVYLFILVKILLMGYKKAQKLEGQNQIIQFGLLAIIIAYLTQAFFNISVIPVAPFFWILLGILYRRSRA